MGNKMDQHGGKKLQQHLRIFRQVKLEDAAKAGATCKTLLNQFLAAQLDRIIGLLAGGVFWYFFQMELMEFRGKTT